MANVHNVKAEITATVWTVDASVGQTVAEGEVLVVLESMKMEIPVAAPIAGVVLEIHVGPEQTVQEGDIVATIEPAS